ATGQHFGIQGGDTVSASKRPTILMGVLLLLLLAYLVESRFSAWFGPNHTPAMPPPLTGKNTISNLDVHQDRNGLWMADFDYFYTGEPLSAMLYIELPAQPNPSDGNRTGSLRFSNRYTDAGLPHRGSHHLSAKIAYPGSEQTTRQV